MALLRNLLSRRFHSLLRTPHRPFTSSPLSEHPISSKPQSKKPLHTLFSEAVGLSEKPAITDDDDERDTELKNQLKQLEQEVRTFNEKTKPLPKKPEKRSLVALFFNKHDSVVKVRKEPEKKELSPDTVMFLQHLFENGYFKDANFAKGKQRFDLAWFEVSYAREYIKFAARKFAADNREIAKWLSGKALKQVAMFGCPSNDKGIVIPAKILRKFFEVPENTVCSKCSLQESCKFANQSVWRGYTNTLNMEVAMKVITSYALGCMHPHLVVPDEVNKSISHLLKEVVKLSQNT